MVAQRTFVKGNLEIFWMSFSDVFELMLFLADKNSDWLSENDCKIISPGESEVFKSI